MRQSYLEFFINKQIAYLPSRVISSLGSHPEEEIQSMRASYIIKSQKSTKFFIPSQQIFSFILFLFSPKLIDIKPVNRVEAHFLHEKEVERLLLLCSLAGSRGWVGEMPIEGSALWKHCEKG